MGPWWFGPECVWRAARNHTTDPGAHVSHGPGGEPHPQPIPIPRAHARQGRTTRQGEDAMSSPRAARTPPPQAPTNLNQPERVGKGPIPSPDTTALHPRPSSRHVQNSHCQHTSQLGQVEGEVGRLVLQGQVPHSVATVAHCTQASEVGNGVLDT